MTAQEEVEAQVLKTLRTTVAKVYLERQAKVLECKAHGNHYAGESFVFNRYASLTLEDLLLGEKWSNRDGEALAGATRDERKAALAAIHTVLKDRSIAAITALATVVPARFLESTAATKMMLEVNTIPKRLDIDWEGSKIQCRGRYGIAPKLIFKNMEDLEAWVLAGMAGVEVKKPKSFSPNFRRTLPDRLGLGDDASVVAAGMVDRLGYNDLVWLAQRVSASDSAVDIVGDGQAYRMTEGVSGAEREKICAVECARGFRDWVNGIETPHLLRYTMLAWEDFLNHVGEDEECLPSLSWGNILDVGANSPADWVVNTALKQLQQVEQADTFKAEHPDWAADEDLAYRLGDREYTPGFMRSPLSCTSSMLYHAQRRLNDSMGRYTELYTAMHDAVEANPVVLAGVHTAAPLVLMEKFLDSTLLDPEKLSILLVLTANREGGARELSTVLFRVEKELRTFAQHVANPVFLRALRSEIKRLAKG